MKLTLSYMTAPTRKIVINNDYRNRESRTNRAGRGALEWAGGARQSRPSRWELSDQRGVCFG
jgi:hypothetical protein